MFVGHSAVIIVRGGRPRGVRHRDRRGLDVIHPDIAVVQRRRGTDSGTTRDRARHPRRQTAMLAAVWVISAIPCSW